MWSPADPGSAQVRAGERASPSDVAFVQPKVGCIDFIMLGSRGGWGGVFALAAFLTFQYPIPPLPALLSLPGFPLAP